MDRDNKIQLYRHLIDRTVLLAVLFMTASSFDSTEIRTWVVMILFGGSADGVLTLINRRR